MGCPYFCIQPQSPQMPPFWTTLPPPTDFPPTSHPYVHSCLACLCSPQFLFWGWKAPCSPCPTPIFTLGFWEDKRVPGLPSLSAAARKNSIGHSKSTCPWYQAAPSPWWKTLLSLKNKSVSMSAALQFPCFSPELVQLWGREAQKKHSLLRRGFAGISCFCYIKFYEWICKYWAQIS